VLRADLVGLRCVEISRKTRFQSGLWLWKFGQTEGWTFRRAIPRAVHYRWASCIVWSCPPCHPFKSTHTRKSALPLLLSRSFMIRHSWSTEDLPAMKRNWRSEVNPCSLIHWMILRRRRRSRLEFSRFLGQRLHIEPEPFRIEISWGDCFTERFDHERDQFRVKLSPIFIRHWIRSWTFPVL